MSRRPVLLSMFLICLCTAGGGVAVGDASAQAMSPAPLDPSVRNNEINSIRWPMDYAQVVREELPLGWM